MRYFTADTPAARDHAAIGLMLTPQKHNAGQIRHYPVWAADNGCFTQGAAFSLTGFLAWLKALRPSAHRCAFAVAPDVVGDACATLARSAPVLPVIRALGYRAALVAQDGLERLSVPWGAFDVLFLGGSTTWKLSEHAARLAAQAHARGIPVHMGRVNSLKRLHAAQSMGCASADGTMLAYKPDARLVQLHGWLTQMHHAPALAWWEVSA